MKRGIAAHETPNEGATNTWLTPRWIIDALGPFDLDPCAALEEPARVAARYFTIRDNGLAQDWGDASGGQESRGNSGAPSVLLAFGRRARQRLADAEIPGSLMITLNRRVYALPLLGAQP